MYRPEGFENPYNFMTDEAIPKWEGQSSAYEAGADAVLEALKKSPFPVGHLTNILFFNKVPYDATLIQFEGKPGCLVFIPEDTE